MRILVESLKRMYTNQKPIKLKKSDIDNMIVNKVITEDEYMYIIGHEYKK